MKKILLLSVNILISFFVISQTIVGTSAENKNVVLEEFTGIHCGYCPSGHSIAKGIQDANPNDVVIINIHTGGYATPGAGEPDFRTSFGDAIAGQTGLTGYPSGTVNRHVFSGSNTAMGRGEWSGAATTILGQSSYVNVGIEAEIDVQTREITVHVEAYYTGNSPESTNKLNVVLMQNNTLGPQSGGNAGNEYVHMHRLVHMITGQWGEDITTTTNNTFVDRTFTYTIPADYNGVPVELADIEVAAFVAEDNQEIISGKRAYSTLTNFATSNNANLKEIILPQKVCVGSVTPSIKIKNMGSANLTSAEITYSVNGGTNQVYNWTGDLAPLKTTEAELTVYDYTQSQTNTVNIEITAVNGGSDEDATNNISSNTFEKSDETNNLITLTLNTDDYASETSWKLYNSSGTVVKSGNGYSNNKTYTEIFHLDLDCYMFELIDSYGDGGKAYDLKDSDGFTIHSSDGTYGSGEKSPFKTTSEVQTYSITFNVTDGTNPIPNAEVNIDDVGTKTTDASGVAIIDNVYPKVDFDYTITTTGFDKYSDKVTVVDANVTVDAVIIHTGFSEIKANNLSIYPNPTNGIINIKLEETVKNSVLKIVDVNGKDILNKKLNKYFTSIDISKQPKGIYFIKILGTNFEKVSKIILK